MANIKIHSIFDDCIYIEYDKNCHDYFEYIHNDDKNKKLNPIKKLSIHDFVDLFFKDNNNFYLYNVEEEYLEDDLVRIRVKYKYIENTDGNHIYTESINDFYVDKYKYRKSLVEKIIKTKIDELELINDFKDDFFNEYEKEIGDINNRIEPGSLDFIYHYLNSDKNINYESYNINREEFIQFVDSNKKYIHKYIYDNWDELQKVYKTDGIILVGGIFFFLILLLTKNTDKVIFKASEVAMLFATLNFLVTFIVAEKEIYNMKRVRS